jgi:hypothetical protein
MVGDSGMVRGRMGGGEVGYIVEGDFGEGKEWLGNGEGGNGEGGGMMEECQWRMGEGKEWLGNGEGGGMIKEW